MTEEWKVKLYHETGLKKLERFGISLGKTARTVPKLPQFFSDLQAYRELEGDSSIPIEDLDPVLKNLGRDAGAGSGHYFHQDRWAAKKIYDRDPETHVDVGSRLDGFINHLLVFRDVYMVDIRPLNTNIDRLDFIQADATEMGAFKGDSMDSISSLHVAEHFGLGRYGDPIDPEGHSKFMDGLQRVLKPGGRLYFSVPTGRERVEFNKRRVLSPYTVLEQFEDLELISLAGVINGEFRESTQLGDLEDREYACGLFEFTK